MANKIIALVLASVLAVGAVPASAKQISKATYLRYVNEICEKYNCSPELVEAMIEVESSWNPSATSSCGAQGLMQVMPKWQKGRMEKLGVTNLYDPYSNILVGVDLLMDLAKDHDVYEALVAYNCGAYSKVLKRVENGATWEYADKILKRAQELERAHGK